MNSWPRLQIKLFSLNGQKFFLTCLLYGWGISFLLSIEMFNSWFIKFLNSFIPALEAYRPEVTLSLLLAIPLGKLFAYLDILINNYVKEDSEISSLLKNTFYFPAIKIIEKSKYNTNPIQKIICKSILKHLPLNITLDSGKVYIGIAKSVDLRHTGPGEESYLTLIPIFSGYRDKQRNHLELDFDDQFYIHTYDLLIQENDKSNAPNSENTDNSQSRQLSKLIANNQEINKRFELILPMSKIMSIAAFDVKTYLESLIKKRKDSFDVA